MMQDADTSPASPRPGIQAIARAARVLRALEAEPRGLSLAELAAATGLPKSTAHRLVAALADEGFVTTAAGAGEIRLGPGLARLGAAAHDALGDELRPVLAALRSELDETVDLAVLDGPSVRFVEQLPAAHRLRAVSAVGARFPLHCTANGKALLAALPPERADELIPNPLPRFTPATITSRRQLQAELARIRDAGVAFDREEHTEGVCAAGAAVCVRGEPVAAISVPVPAHRFARHERRLAAAVRAAAAAAAARLG